MFRNRKLMGSIIRSTTKEINDGEETNKNRHIAIELVSDFINEDSYH